MKFNNIFIKKIFACVLLVATLFAVFAPVADAASSVKKVKTKQEARKKINHLKWLENVEHKKLYKNQQKLETTSSDLKYSQKKYESTTSELAALEARLAMALSEYSTVDFQLKNRIRQVYKKQRKGFFLMLLSANDFGMFFDRVYFASIVIKSDMRRMERARAKAREISALKYSIEEKKYTLAKYIKRMDSQQKSIKKEIAQNENMIHKLRTDRVAYEKAEKELAKQSQSIGTMINRTSNKSDVKVVSTFIKPIGGRITSPFGWRTHPIFNSRSFHSGVDIAGPYRGSVRASNSGKVIYSGWYGGYGKVVIIDHGNVGGNPVTTLYAHLDSIKVSNGQFVQKGQVVGAEGTTGYSTGPHCHFEVRVNGKPKNPLNYI